MVAGALQEAGLDVVDLTLERAEGGRSQLYTVTTAGGGRAFAKVYARDSRDADILYRSYRRLLLRGPSEAWPSISLQGDVEHQAFLLLRAGQGDVSCPRVELVTRLPDGSMALALEYIDGRRLDEFDPETINAEMLDAVWSEVRTLHERHLAHRALRAGNVMIVDGRPVLLDFGFGEDSASPRMQAIDRAELLASLGSTVGPEPAVAAAVRVLGPTDAATALPFLQPLGLSAATRRAASKTLLKELRASVETTTGQPSAPLEPLVRVRPRTLLTITALVGAFYVLLPQLANVGDSFVALRSANWGWLAVAIVMSGLTYIAAALCTLGSVPEPLPFVPTVGAQMASSFVNRITPANVGGMALNVRFMQKAGVEPASAVTGVGLNTFIGAVVHLGLLGVFFTWAGRDSSAAFHIPADSKVLVIIAVVLAVAGVFIATRRGRKIVRTQVLGFVRRSWASLARLAHSPVRLAALLGGSVAVTLAYITALGIVHGRVSRQYELRPSRGRLPRCVADRGRRADTWRPRRDGGCSGGRFYRCGRGPRGVRRRSPELPAGDVLAADPPRLGQLPPPRPPGSHLTPSVLSLRDMARPLPAAVFVAAISVIVNSVWLPYHPVSCDRSSPILSGRVP